MTKSKRSSLKADSLYLRAFRVRTTSDARRDVAQPAGQDVNEAEEQEQAVATSITTPQSTRTASIRLVSPSPPQSAGTTVVEDHKPPQRHSSLSPDSTSTNQVSSVAQSTQSQATPIYDQMATSTPSRGPSQANHLGRGISAQFTPTRTFSRSMSPNNSEEGFNLQPRSVSGLGSTSKIIQSLTSEKESLQRDLAHQELVNAEAQKTHEIDVMLLRQAREAEAQAVALYESSNSVLKRQDKKLEKLAGELAEQRKARKEADERLTQTLLELRSKTTETDKIVTTAEEKAAQFQEQAKHYQQQLEIVQQQYLRSRVPWQPEIKKLQDKMEVMVAKIHEMAVNQVDSKVFLAENDAQHAEFMAVSAKFNREKESLFGDALKRLKDKEVMCDDALQELNETRDKMRWTMAVKKNVKDAK